MMRIACGLVAAALVCSAADDSVIVNARDAEWKHDKGDPPGSESIVLRESAETGALEFLTRYPAGHVTRRHWHSVNERIVVLEGRIEFRAGDRKETLDPGGFAYFPGKQVHEMKCISSTRCGFYLYWDGKPDFHRE